jgi:hypothetical protein
MVLLSRLSLGILLIEQEISLFTDFNFKLGRLYLANVSGRFDCEPSIKIGELSQALFRDHRTRSIQPPLEPAPNYKGMNPEGESIKPEDEDEDDQDADTGNLESDENKAPRQTN